jgi:hypothetical protein
MNPATLTIVISGAVKLLEWAIPEIQKRVTAGEISVPEQAQLLAQIAALRDKTSAEYAGPENELSGR